MFAIWHIPWLLNNRSKDAKTENSIFLNCFLSIIELKSSSFRVVGCDEDHFSHDQGT